MRRDLREAGNRGSRRTSPPSICEGGRTSSFWRGDWKCRCRRRAVRPVMLELRVAGVPQLQRTFSGAGRSPFHVNSLLRVCEEHSIISISWIWEQALERLSELQRPWLVSDRTRVGSWVF